MNFKKDEKYRVGIGYDLHKIVKGKKLFLGGVNVKNNFGLRGHSDGDVILHSICDAILGACELPDIGELFPDTNPKIKGIDSKLIAKKVLELSKQKGYKIVNIDIVIICDKPKISPIKKQLMENLRKVFQTQNVNIKGKTTEGKKCSYIEVFSIVLVSR